MLRRINQPITHSRWPIVKALLLSFLSSLLLILSFPRFNLEFLAWVGFLPLFFALENKSRKMAFALSYFTGIIFWWGSIYWLVHVTLLGTILLVFYLALYFGIFGFFFSSRGHGPWTMDTLFIPSLWVILEYLRSHLLTGFPWALMGHSQYLNLPIIQIADITGAWGVSFLVIMVNVAIWQFRKKSSYLLTIACIASVLCYGYYRLYTIRDTQCTIHNRITVIQGNIRQELKWDPRAKDLIINKYQDISLESAAKDKPDMIIWPEAALPVVREEEPEYYNKAITTAILTDTPILLGALTSNRDGYHNSALLISREAKLLQQYDKLHLVPFGEYIPLRKIFPFLQAVAPIGDVSRGKEHTLFKVPAKNSQPEILFGALICFEDLFPGLSRKFVNKGAHFLVNITNDAWYEYSSAAYQHLQSSVFRAVENHVYLVRSANTGISGFIAPSGKIISLVKNKAGDNIFVNGYDTQDIPLITKSLSLYTRYGDFFIGICLFLIFCGIISALKSKKG